MNDRDMKRITPFDPTLDFASRRAALPAAGGFASGAVRDGRQAWAAESLAIARRRRQQALDPTPVDGLRAVRAAAAGRNREGASGIRLLPPAVADEATDGPGGSKGEGVEEGAKLDRPQALARLDAPRRFGDGLGLDGFGREPGGARRFVTSDAPFELFVEARQRPARSYRVPLLGVVIATVATLVGVAALFLRPAPPDRGVGQENQTALGRAVASEAAELRDDGREAARARGTPAGTDALGSRGASGSLATPPTPAVSAMRTTDVLPGGEASSDAARSEASSDATRSEASSDATRSEASSGAGPEWRSQGGGAEALRSHSTSSALGSPAASSALGSPAASSAVRPAETVPSKAPLRRDPGRASSRYERMTKGRPF